MAVQLGMAVGVGLGEQLASVSISNASIKFQSAFSSCCALHKDHRKLDHYWRASTDSTHEYLMNRHSSMPETHFPTPHCVCMPSGQSISGP